MKCSGCAWEGVLATVEHFDAHGYKVVSEPLCLICRGKLRDELRSAGFRHTRVVRSKP